MKRSRKKIRSDGLAPMIELIFAPYQEMFRYFAQGWYLVSTMAGQGHGEWSVLMERDVAD